MLGTLGAAYAETGNFNGAVAAATEASDLAQKKADNLLWQRNKDLLGLYQKRQSFHELEKLVPGQK